MGCWPTFEVRRVNVWKSPTASTGPSATSDQLMPRPPMGQARGIPRRGHSKVSGAAMNPPPQPSPARGEGARAKPSQLAGERWGRGTFRIDSTFEWPWMPWPHRFDGGVMPEGVSAFAFERLLRYRIELAAKLGRRGADLPPSDRPLRLSCGNRASLTGSFRLADRGRWSLNSGALRLGSMTWSLPRFRLDLTTGAGRPRAVPSSRTS